MPNYITLGNWTEQGIKNVKESPKRADAVTALANKLGAKMQIFYTMGRYDIVALTEAPNDDVAMQLLLETLASVSEGCEVSDESPPGTRDDELAPEDRTHETTTTPHIWGCGVQW